MFLAVNLKVNLKFVMIKILNMTLSHKRIDNCPQESGLTHQSSCTHHLYSFTSQNPIEDRDLAGFSLILQDKHNRTSKDVGIYRKLLCHSEQIIAFSHWIKAKLLQTSRKSWMHPTPLGDSLIPFGARRVCMHWGKAKASASFRYKHLTIISYSPRWPKREEMSERSLLSFSCSAKSLISVFQTIIEDFVAKVTSFLRTQIFSRVITFPCYSPEGKKSSMLVFILISALIYIFLQRN